MADQQYLIHSELQSDLKKVLSDDYTIHLEGIKSLTKYGRTAVEELIKLLRGRYVKSSRVISDALEEMGEVSIEPIIEYIKSIKYFETEESIFILETLLEPFFKFKDKRIIEVLMGVLAKLNETIKTNPNPLIRDLARNSKVKIYSLLAVLGSQAALDDMYAFLEGGLRRAPVEVIDALSAIGDKRFLGILLKLYLNELKVSEWGARAIKNAFREICRREGIQDVNNEVFKNLSQEELNLVEKLLPRVHTRGLIQDIQ